MKLPSGDIAQPKVGGTAMGTSHSMNPGKEPETGVDTIKPFAKASGAKGEVNKSTLATKETHIGGVPMGK